MKIKRWMVLTAIFSALGGAIVVSGCQPSNTVSTNNTLMSNTTVNISNCTQDCMQACVDSCVECSTVGCQDCINTCFYTCGSFDPFSVSCNGDPIQWCLDCGCAFTQECGDNMDDDSDSSGN